MNICMIAPEFIPFWGGTGSYTINLVKNLPENIDIHIITPFRKGFNSSSITPRTFNSKQFGSNVYIHFISKASDTFVYNANFQIECMNKIPSLNRKYKFDIIHTHHPHMPDILLQIFNKIKIPTVCTVHSLFQWMNQSIKRSKMNFSDLDRSEKGIRLLYPMLKQLESFHLRHADILIAPSKYCRNDLMNFFKINNEKINVMYNGIDTDLFSKNEGNFSNHIQELKGRPIILFVGRPIAQKGLYFLIKTMKTVIRNIPNSYFLFVGGGDFSPYQKEFNRVGIPNNNYKYLGYVEYLKMPEIYSLCTLFVLPSPHENCSMSLLEAMSCSRVTIASNVGGTPEIIKHGINGILFDYGDVEGLAEKIIMLIKNNDLRRKIGFHARNTIINEFSIKKMAAKTLSLYENLLENKLY